MEKRIFEIMTEINEGILNYSGSNLVKDEIIDSFELISLISRLEEEFDLDIDAKYVNEENFGNKDKIIALISSLRSQ